MAARDLGALLDAVTAAGSLPPVEAEPLLRKYLGHKNALVVTRAAKQAGKLDLRSLAPQLVEAFTRFMPPHDAATLDPQCWAKNEIIRALAAFEFQQPEVFFASLHYHQWEPSWSGRSDTSGPMRGHAALALVQCREVPSDGLLRQLLSLFADKDIHVRINVARAIEQLGTPACALLLRLRAELASDEPELLIACIGGVLRLEGEAALPWVAAFLKQEDGLATEAAFLLAEFRRPAALALLQKALHATRNEEMQEALLRAIASTRLPEAWTFLLDQSAQRGLLAGAARAALLAADPPDEVRAALKQA